MSDDVVIKVDHVSKDFVLPHEKVTSVKGLFTSVYRKRTKTKEVQHALKDVSFEIKKGEFFGIVGRNGSGKSTMLKMLAGIYQPTEGKIWTKGKLVPFIELGVGFNPELTGRENVYLNGAMMGFSEKHVESMYDEIVAFAELEEFMDQKLKNYSSGMQVRLAFSVAVKAEAEILIVDEVLAVGDSDFQQKCYDYFKSLKRNNKTVVFVSHDMSAVREYCDRVVLIESSEMQGIGNPTHIAGKYERLFAKELSVEPEFVAEDRWGTGVVKAKEVHLPKNSLGEHNDELVITVTLEAAGTLKDSKSLMTGFRVFNAAGQCLHEANSWGTVLPVLKPGETCDVTWRCPNIYNSGKYSIGIFVNTDSTVSDSWDAAAFFQVKKKLHRGVLVELPVKISVEKKG